MPKQTASLFEHFKNISDPRVNRTKRHNLLEIIVIAICAILCGADTWTDIEEFGNSKMEWFKTFLELPNGIPSHDTFGRVFALLDPEQFERSFQSWVATIAILMGREVVAIDGKTARRSHGKSAGPAALHLVSAFATRNGLTLGERAIDTKSNELKAIPKLLRILALSGCIVTIDAAGCYPEIIEQIIENKADYIVAVKRNQPTLYTDIESIFSSVPVGGRDTEYQEGRAHGRAETRECFVVTDPLYLSRLRTKDAWKNLASVVKIAGTRKNAQTKTSDARYYISSMADMTADKMLEAVRNHWRIENSLHWILDIAFREDESRIRKGHAQENFALMRKISLNLLKQEKTVTKGIRAKRMKAGWDAPYLLKVLGI
ncbi:MAG: ISAs1 family transposase [Candidatus Lloydbacteria bacterium]|nr:ISAs1 family transposase [Candidatus Lloydbacteria bacterium]